METTSHRQECSTINESDEVQNHNPHKNSLEDQIRNVASRCRGSGDIQCPAQEIDLVLWFERQSLLSPFLIVALSSLTLYDEAAASSNIQ